jgi:hypothetical protein
VYQVEDERFEVDMVIDANMCTIRVLEPLAEEIATMKAVEAMPRGPGACVTWLCVLWKPGFLRHRVDVLLIKLHSLE